MEGSISGPSEKRVAVVTGGNRGMGLEICRQLAAHGLTVVLTARDEKRGTEAAEKLREEGLPDVMFHQLEISEPASAAHLAASIKDKFGKLDILVQLLKFSNEVFNLQRICDTEGNFNKIDDHRTHAHP
ncbi:hypothetical protein VPH35_005012 [Triticum aestivum]